MATHQPEVYEATSAWNKYTFICRKIIKWKKLLILTRTGCFKRSTEDIKSLDEETSSVFSPAGCSDQVCVCVWFAWCIPLRVATPGGQHGEWVLCEMSVGQCLSTRGRHCTCLNKDFTSGPATFTSLELKPAEKETFCDAKTAFYNLSWGKCGDYTVFNGLDV